MPKKEKAGVESYTKSSKSPKPKATRVKKGTAAQEMADALEKPKAVRAPKSEGDAIKSAKKPYSRKKSEPRASKTDTTKLRIIPLGGLNEIGKNMTVIEYGDDIIIVDCGLGFPDEDMFGIDLVIPDITYLENNRDKIRGIFLTHGHEDHIGAVPYILRSINPPVFGTRLTLGIVKNKLTEFSLPWDPQFREVNAGDTIKAGVFSVEFIRVNHSIADACCLAINTPRGMLIHTGDFKLDLTPIEGEMMNITRLGELGKKGVLLLMCESTNAERPGYTPSERKVGQSMEYIFSTNKDKRIVVRHFRPTCTASSR